MYNNITLYYTDLFCCSGMYFPCYVLPNTDCTAAVWRVLLLDLSRCLDGVCFTTVLPDTYVTDYFFTYFLKVFVTLSADPAIQVLEKSLYFLAFFSEIYSTYSAATGCRLTGCPGANICFNLLWRIEICKSDLVWRWFENPE